MNIRVVPHLAHSTIEKDTSANKAPRAFRKQSNEGS